MSLSVWQENRAIDLRAKGFPPVEVSRVIGAREEEVRIAWPKLVRAEIALPLRRIERPRPIEKKPDAPKPVLVWPKERVGGVQVTPLQRLPAAPPQVRKVLREVAQKHGLSVRVMLAPRNLAVLVHARQEAMWRLRSEQNRTWNRIAKFFACDHTTVIHGFASHVARTKARA